MKIWLEEQCVVCGQSFQAGGPYRGWLRSRRMVKALENDLANTRDDHLAMKHGYWRQ